MSDHVFKLIHSLDKKEKGYFKKYAKMNKSDPKFLELYEYINKMDNYDEERLRRKFRTSSDSLKSDLQKKLLEALADFHKANLDSSSAHHALVLLPVLLEKKLDHYFEQRLKKAKEQAETSENWSTLYELLNFEKKYLKKSINNRGLAEKYKEIYQQQNQCVAAQQQETYWENIYLQLNFILKHDHRLLKEDNRKRFDSIGSACGTEVEKLLSTKAKFYYHSSQNVYLRHARNPKKQAIEQAEQLVDFLKDKDHEKYIDALCGLARAYSADEQFEKQGEIIEQLRQIAQHQSGNDIEMFEKICRFGVKYYLNVGQFEESGRLADEMERRWEKIQNKTQLFQQQLYCYNFILTYWILANYDKALFWLALILEYKFTPEGKNYLMGARLLELMVYYDCRLEVLDSRLDSIKRVLNEHWEISDYEKDIFSFFNKLIKKPQREHNSVFQDFQTLLEPYAKKRFIASSEMLYWCRAKIEAKTVREVIEENN